MNKKLKDPEYIRTVLDEEFALKKEIET